MEVFVFSFFLIFLQTYEMQKTKATLSVPAIRVRHYGHLGGRGML